MYIEDVRKLIGGILSKSYSVEWYSNYGGNIFNSNKKVGRVYIFSGLSESIPHVTFCLDGDKKQEEFYSLFPKEYLKNKLGFKAILE